MIRRIIRILGRMIAGRGRGIRGLAAEEGEGGRKGGVLVREGWVVGWGVFWGQRWRC